MPTTTPFNNLITFSRGSNATVTGSNGLIQWAPSNLVTFSEQFDNAAWTKNAATITANNAAAPDGTSTADTFSADGTTNIHFVRQTVAAFVFPWVFSAYIKAGTANFVQMFFGVDTAVWANFDIATGVVGSVGSNQTASITPVGNGWYRCSIFSNSSTATNPAVAIVSSASAARAEINSLNTNVLLWGAQLEIGSTATTYNPTTVKNLLGFSEAFDNAAWVKTRAFIVTGAAANPINGLFNAQKLMEDTTASNSHVVTGAGGTVGSVETLSVYARAAGRQWLTFQIGTTASAYFNIGTGVLGTVTNGTASIVNIGGGWYRCSLTATRVGTTNNFIFLASADLTVNYTGDGNSGVYIYGAQLSDSASLDPYVPTPGAAPSSTAFYGPRFDFDPVTLQPRGLLVEEQRTNLTTFSDQFDNAAWSKVGATATANTTTSPDGAVNADSISASGGSTQHYVSQSFSFTSGTAYTLSVFAKKNTLNGVQLTFGSGAFGTFPYANFDVNAGTTAAFNCTSTITNFGNGWYRCTMTATASATTAAIGVIGLARDNAEARLATFSSDGNGVFAYGAQLEAGAFATSYIPTVASTVTRSADVATITGQNFAQWFNQSEGTWAFDFGPFNFAGTIAGTAPYDTAIGAVTNGVRAGKQFSAQNFTGWSVQNKTGTPVGSATIAGSATLAPLNGPAAAQKLAIFQSPSASGGVVNGGTVTTTTLTATPTGTADLFYINPLMNGWFRNIRFIPARAADFQLQGLST